MKIAKEENAVSLRYRIHRRRMYAFAYAYRIELCANVAFAKGYKYDETRDDFA